MPGRLVDSKLDSASGLVGVEFTRTKNTAALYFEMGSSDIPQPYRSTQGVLK